MIFDNLTNLVSVRKFSKHVVNLRVSISAAVCEQHSDWLLNKQHADRTPYWPGKRKRFAVAKKDLQSQNKICSRRTRFASVKKCCIMQIMITDTFSATANRFMWLKIIIDPNLTPYNCTPEVVPSLVTLIIALQVNIRCAPKCSACAPNIFSQGLLCSQ